MVSAPLIQDVDAPAPIDSEETPLIPDRQASAQNEKPPRSIPTQFAIYGGALLFVLGTGALSWAIDRQIHKGQARPPPEEVFEWKSQLLGWISAVLYRKLFPMNPNVPFTDGDLEVGARIPQIGTWN